MSIKIDREKSAEIEYPIAMQATDSRLVVIFTGLKTGLRVIDHCGNPDFNYIESWFAHTEKSHWKPVTITISSP